MNTVVVQAHPVPDSFNAAILERVEIGLASQPQNTASVFRLGLGERPSMAQLSEAERLVLVYPTWWGGQPAMLVDWLHDVMLTGGQPLSSVIEVCAVTTCGGSVIVNAAQGEWGKHWLGRHLLAECRSGATLDWLPLYKMDRLTPERAATYLSEIEQRFSTSSPASASRVDRLRNVRRSLA